jgi:hypothetical protein
VAGTTLSVSEAVSMASLFPLTVERNQRMISEISRSEFARRHLLCYRLQ